MSGFHPSRTSTPNRNLTPRQSRASTSTSDTDVDDSITDRTGPSLRQPIYNPEPVLNLLTVRLEQLVVDDNNLDIAPDLANMATAAELLQITQQQAQAIGNVQGVLQGLGQTIGESVGQAVQRAPPADKPNVKVTDVKIPPITMGKDGAVDIFSLVSFERDTVALIAASDPTNTINATRWNNYIFASLPENIKRRLIGFKPEDHATIKDCCKQISQKLSENPTPPPKKICSFIFERRS